jgi:hypothetical protein
MKQQSQKVHSTISQFFQRREHENAEFTLRKLCENSLSHGSLRLKFMIARSKNGCLSIF